MGVSAIAVAALALTGCAPEETVGSAPGGFVQDLWIIDQIVAVNVDEESIDITDAITANFDGMSADRVVELAEGVTFHEYSVLNPTIVDTDVDARRPRADIEMTAGFIETDNGRNLTILATPDPATRVPIYFKDVVKFDLSFLGDLIAPGDPLLFDYAFLQAIPTLHAAETGLGSLELLRHRMLAGSVQYFGTTDDAVATALKFTDQIGVVLEGSNLAGMPAKAKDLEDGIDAGVEACGKKTRGSPLKCVNDFLGELYKGAAGSWVLIEEQLEYVDEEVEKQRKETAKERTSNKGKRVKPDAPVKCKPSPGKVNATQEESAAVPGAGGNTINGCPPGSEPDPGNEHDGNSAGNGKGGSVSGEPHFRTFDGARFDMQGVGEYVAARHESLTVQIRTHPVTDSVTSVSAVALAFGDHTMMIEAAELHVDGALATETLIELDGVRIVNKNHLVTVQFEDGQLVRVANRWKWVLDLEVWNPVAGDWVGMLGNADGEPANDFALRSGAAFSEKPTFEQIHRQFSESWRVSQRESLFVYRDGDTTETFTDRSYPRASFTVEDLSPAHRKQAERMCRAAGIQDASVFLNCVLDYGLLGELDDLSVPGQLGTLRSAVSADQAEAFIQGRISSLGQRVPAKSEKSSDGVTDLWWMESPADDPAAWLVTGEELLGERRMLARLSCASGGEFGPVWGGHDAYAMSSSVCTAAVHAGVITRANGGSVSVYRLDEVGSTVDYSAFDDFAGYAANGVTSEGKPAGPGFNFGDEPQ